MSSGDEGSEYASTAEVRSALMTLSIADYGRLTLYGRNLLRMYGDFAEGRSPADLAQEAIERTLNGTRRWRHDKIDICRHIMSVMRSRMSHLVQRYRKRRDLVPMGQHQQPEADVTASIDGIAVHYAASISSLEDSCHAAQVLSQIDRALENDQHLQRFYRCLVEHEDEASPGPSIQRALDISATQYNALKRRLTRTLRKLFD